MLIQFNSVTVIVALSEANPLTELNAVTAILPFITWKQEGTLFILFS